MQEHTLFHIISDFYQWVNHSRYPFVQTHKLLIDDIISDIEDGYISIDTPVMQANLDTLTDYYAVWISNNANWSSSVTDEMFIGIKNSEGMALTGSMIVDIIMKYPELKGE